MKILADLHIAPRTVEHLRRLGHDVVRVGDVLPPGTSDEGIVAAATREQRVVLTQDLDFSDIIALSGSTQPSLLTLRLSSSRVEHVNAVLEKLLPVVEQELLAGAIVTLRDGRIRRRSLPID